MLVLTRRTNQSIVIGPDVTITVVEIRGEQVRLGISAPRHVTVHREEVLEQIRDENRRAAAMSGDDTAMLPRRAPEQTRRPNAKR
ncbi:MAG: carbon storage regulator CsrA [Acidimicrobiia bacterium]